MPTDPPRNDAQDTHDAPAAPLALPSTSDAPSVGLGEQVKLDKLGPVVVNSDGTLARLPNWDKMTPDEQQRTVRILAKRNQARLEKLRQPAP
ncbi:hypothetical protein MBRA1_003929 [Malassezia brasiliensis]|uniref:Uncharacterized protein n=1 Tax=Malassezia brasiliensis TaxID=1821822 RepID=A0AAF0IQ98_9BASI|nr:hypothetical protein MBRA1_003929 [Malassezia brasiliensis]